MKTGGRHKVPVILQMEATECGAASLAMILAYYGLWLPLADLRYDCGISRDGSNLGNVAQAAKMHGMETHSYKLDPEDLDAIVLPCIAHWDFNHFVVITGVDRKYVYINDPARGKLKLTYEEVGKSLTGIVLSMSPGPDFSKGGKRSSIISFVKERMRGTGEALLITFLTGLLMSIVGLIMPIATQIFADDILPGKNPEWFAPFMVIFGVLMMVQVVVQVISGLLSNPLKMKMSINGNTSFLWHMLRLPMRFFEQHSPGDLISRQQKAAGISATIVGKFAPFITNVSLLLLYLFLMMKYNMALAGIAALVTALNMLLVRAVSEKQIDLIRIAERNRGKLSGATMSSLTNIDAIKAAGVEKEFYERWSGEFAASYNADVKMNTAISYINVFPRILVTLGNTLVLGIGAWYILQGRMTIGMLMAFQSLLNSFMGTSDQLGNTFSDFLTMRADMERMDDVYRADLDPALVRDHEIPFDGEEKLRGKLELKNVSFGYNRLDDPLLENFSLTLEPGKSVALVGSTGCGKSTVAKLVMGLIQPWSGEILYDGKPLSEINRHQFVSSVAIIDQDHVTFKGSVSDNVKMWDGTIEDFAMKMACYQAQIHYDIASRPEAYDTEMADGGSNFSGGQLQRIEIAGALVREPVILIMDEATSALDALTEEAVMQSIKDMGITLIIVAHRLSTIRDCDEIILMDKGHIAERGTHESLFAAKGRYYDLMSAGETV